MVFKRLKWLIAQNPLFQTIVPTRMEFETEDFSSDVEELSQSQSVYFPSDDSQSPQASPGDESQVRSIVHFKPIKGLSKCDRSQN